MKLLSILAETSVTIGCFVFWIATYLLIIKRGFQDRTYGMPVVASAGNMAWEFTLSFILPVEPPLVYTYYLWVALDLVIIFQVLRFGPAALKDMLSRQWFYLAYLATLVTALGAVWTITVEFQNETGCYAAFIQNLMMSCLFIAMCLKRPDLSGQSLYIAISKMLGTLSASIVFSWINRGAPFLTFLYIAIFFYDWVYIILVYRKSRQLGLNPWTRW